MSITSSFVNSGNYWAVNKSLAKSIGIMETIFLMEIVFLWDIHKFNKENPGWVFIKQEEMKDRIGIGRTTQTKFLNKLKGMGFVSVEQFGGQRRNNYYKVNEANLDNFLINLQCSESEHSTFTKRTNISINNKIIKKKKRLSKDNQSDKSHKIKKNNSEQKKRILKKIVKKEKVPVIKSKYKHTTTDLRNYNELKSHGITNHKKDTKAEIDSLDKLHALFSNNCKDPYYPVYIPEEFIDFKWSMDDLIEVFNYHLEHYAEYSMKPVRAIGKFIFSEGFNGHKSWSPLLYWAQKMTKTAEGELTEDGERLFKSMKRYKIDGVINLDSSIINKVADDLFSLSFNYCLKDGSTRNMNYPYGVVDCLSKFIKGKTNRSSFKLVYITKKGFVEDFIETAVKQNQIKKKTSRRGVN